MANFYVTHHKYPSNPQLFTIALDKVRGFGVQENNPNFKPSYWLAEPTWKVFIYTSGLDTNGDAVGPLVADVFGSAETVNEFIEDKVAELCGLIDWSQQGEYSIQVDANGPIITEQYPNPFQTDVPISSPIVIRVQDPIPGNGIDPSSVVMKVDGYTVTPNGAGNKFDYTFTYKPRPVFDS